MAKYSNDIGGASAPAWYRMWEREKREAELAKVGKINWDQLLSAAHDYMDARRYFLGNDDFKGHYFGDQLSGLKRQSYDASNKADEAERILYTACYATGVPEDAVIRAARIEYRYYDRGGSQCIDAERLIRSQL